ncbi:hypothetical protein AAIR98_001367 [Elusimicrobium simillimum]|uniref:DUF5681 domain-containing protein n=1 Tax=Elusimicrobium simillimum TaxID=3143438 RepID=UPI003C6F80DE
MGDKNYDVGYGKPPKEHQFKPGQSGNTRGRPVRLIPRVSLLPEEICNALNCSVNIKEDGKRRAISVKEAIAKRLVNDAMSGKISAVKYIARMTADLDVDYMRESLHEIAQMNEEIKKAHRRRRKQRELKKFEVLEELQVNDENEG